MNTPDKLRAAPRRRLRAIARGTGRWLWNGLAVVGLLSVIYFGGFDLSQIVSGSMTPTLQGEGGPDGDWVLAERVSFWFREPRRWEVVQFHTPDHMLVAKRVVGLPGETVSLVDHQVAIGGTVMTKPVNVSHLSYLPYGNVSQDRSVACGTGYYVLGDETRDSFDSRFDGPVPPERICGRAWLIVWPPSRIGFVNP
ncbi:MAG: signal peptidase I [Phycisphaerae bacterium]|nr:signal peptidase I [Phycisphaerae bacterium]